MKTRADLPSDKLTKSCGKSSFLMEKFHYKWSFSIAMLNYQRVQAIYHWVL